MFLAISDPWDVPTPLKLTFQMVKLRVKVRVRIGVRVQGSDVSWIPDSSNHKHICPRNYIGDGGSGFAEWNYGTLSLEQQKYIGVSWL
jgi:hypothetical protein